jgi:hypothetical protein
MNAIVQKLDFEGLKEIYMMANTPGYLFKNIRSLASVESLAKNYSVDELQNALEEIATEPISEIAGLLSVYAILIALSFKPLYQIKPLLENLELQIQWGDHLKELILAHANQVNEISSTTSLAFGSEKPRTPLLFPTSELLIKL